MDREGGEEQLSDELLGAVVEAVRPERPRGHGQAWERCETERDRIKAWLDAEVPVVKIVDLLAGRGVVVPPSDVAPLLRRRAGLSAGEDDGAGG